MNLDLASVDLTQVDRAMADVESRAKRMGPAFRQLRRPMLADQTIHARSQTGPDGKWAPRSPLTEARRRARNRGLRAPKALKTIAIGKGRRRTTPKRILGRLPSAVVTTIRELSIKVTSRVAAFSNVQQRGGRVGKRARIPARPFLWMSTAFLYYAKGVFAQHLVKGWQR